MNKRKDYNMSYNTNIIGYSVRIEELFKEGNSKPTQIKVYAESAENLYSFGHWFTKTYEIKVIVYSKFRIMVSKPILFVNKV